MKTKQTHQPRGNSRHLADSHLSEKRPVDSGQRESSVLPKALPLGDGRIMCGSHFKDDNWVIVLQPTTPPGDAILHITGRSPGEVRLSNVNQITRLIDGLYAVGATWQKQDQQPE